MADSEEDQSVIHLSRNDKSSALHVNSWDSNEILHGGTNQKTAESSAYRNYDEMADEDGSMVNGTSGDKTEPEDSLMEASEEKQNLLIQKEEEENRKPSQVHEETELSDEIKLENVEEGGGSKQLETDRETVTIAECEAAESKEKNSINKKPVCSESSAFKNVVKNNMPSTSSTLPKAFPLSTSFAKQPKPDMRYGKTETPGKGSASPVSNYRPVAKLLINIGMEIVREGVIKNLIDIQAEKEKQQKLDSKEKMQLEKLEESWRNIAKKNTVFRVPVKHCRCRFLAFTQMALDTHRQFGHGIRPGKYRCCYCTGFKTTIPTKFISHMGKEHRKFGKLWPLPLFSCPFCPFENKLPSPLERHVIGCQKKFTLTRNLQINSNIFDIPVFEAVSRPRPMVSLAPVKPVPVGFPRPSVISNPVGPNNQGKISNPVFLSGPAGIYNPMTGISIADILSACGLSPQIQAQVLSNLSLHASSQSGRGQNYLPNLGRSGIPNSSSQPMMLHPTSSGNWMPAPSIISQNSIQPQRLGFSQQQSASKQVVSVVSQPRQQFQALGAGSATGQRQSLVSFTQISQAKPNLTASRRMGLPQTGIASGSMKCEICDQPIRDLNSLRLHFASVHREKVDDENFLNKGRTLSCQACNERFWTKQGVLHHYQTRHSSVTPPRTYQCVRCGAKVATSILNHLSSQHNITVLDMYEAKCCMLCNTRLRDLALFESHVVSEHADIFPNRMVLLTMIKALNVASMYKTMGKPDTGSIMTHRLLPASVEDSLGRSERLAKMRVREKFSCQDCCIQFSTPEELEFHCEKVHVYRCSRCSERWSSLEMMQQHFTSKHHSEKDPCVLCGEMVQIGRPTVRHMKRMHIRSCSVVVRRLRPKVAMRFLMKRRAQIQNHSHQPVKSSLDEVTDLPFANSKSLTQVQEPFVKKEDLTKVEEIMEVDGETIVIETNT